MRIFVFYPRFPKTFRKCVVKTPEFCNSYPKNAETSQIRALIYTKNFNSIPIRTYTFTVRFSVLYILHHSMGDSLCIIPSCVITQWVVSYRQKEEHNTPTKRRNEMKYRINYLHKPLHQEMWREAHEIVTTLEKLKGTLEYMEKNSKSYKLVSILPVK